MDIKLVAASIVVVSVLGTGGYLIVKNNVAVELNLSNDGSDQAVRTHDFRDLIADYSTLTPLEKKHAIDAVYDALSPEQKIAAKQEILALGKEVNRKAHEGFGESNGTGFTPPGWE